MNSSSSISSVASAERPGLLVPALLLASSLVFFGVPGLGGDLLDQEFQGLFFGADGWLISWDSGFWHALLYKGPKALLIAWLAFVLWCAIKPDLGPDWMGRRRAFYLLASSFAVVMVCTQLRAFTGQTVPHVLKPWKPDGLEHLLLFQAKPPGYPSDAFPAGHASGGFALLSLAWAWSGRTASRLGFAAGLGFGGFMGLYQIARGEHFLSHTTATGLIAWLLCAGLARLMRPAVTRPPSS